MNSSILLRQAIRPHNGVLMAELDGDEPVAVVGAVGSLAFCALSTLKKLLLLLVNVATSNYQ